MGETDIIMVVKREDLFGEEGEDYFQDFRDSKIINYESRILKNYKWMRRGKPDENLEDSYEKNESAESNPDYKQPIGYALVINKKLGKIYVYKRVKKQHEMRLAEKITWGFGGHIEKIDISPGTNPISQSMIREVTEEELEIKGNVKVSVLGYINDDSNSVGKVHFGILYLIETNANEIIPKEGIEWIKPMTLEEIEELSKNPEIEIESWSRIALLPLKKILN